MDLGLTEAGVHIRNSYEMDKACCDTQRVNFSHRVVQCDIAKKLVGCERGADVHAFTYPCTRYSSAADIQGVRTGDELYLHALRHLALQPPEVYILENVPGMKKFPVVMEAMTRLPGYYVHVFCPVKSETWLPQRRDRLFIFGSRRRFAWRLPESHRQVSLAEILEDNPQVEIPDYFYKRLRGEYRDLPIISDPASGDIMPTCVAHYSKDVSTRAVVDRRFPKGVRPYTVREYARAQGVPDSFRFVGTTQQAYRMIGNGVSVDAARWAGQEIVRYFNRAPAKTNAQTLLPFFGCN